MALTGGPRQCRVSKIGIYFANFEYDTRVDLLILIVSQHGVAFGIGFQ